eukprot:6953030-Lingulodinium_polyedra.AAC.1
MVPSPLGKAAPPTGVPKVVEPVEHMARVQRLHPVAIAHARDPLSPDLPGACPAGASAPSPRRHVAHGWT